MTSLTQFLLHEQRKFPHAHGDFTLLIDSIAAACKAISHAVHRGALAGVLGSQGTENSQGEVQKKLDVITHELFVNALHWTGHVAALASEEEDDIIPLASVNSSIGDYLICFDPLDGSSNIDLNLSVGTIFSVLRRPSAVTQPGECDFLQSGHAQVAAGFCIYGPATVLVLTTGNGVNGFTLDTDIGEFILTHPNMRIPADTAEFAVNMSNRRYWEEPVRRYVEECVQGKDGVRGKDFNMRWIASMVAEVFRVLTRGGLFMYPMDSKVKAKGGRLRLLYEANPMSFIVEQAGGAASTGRQRILDIQPHAIHQRVPVILGAKHEVERLVDYHLANDAAAS